MSVQQERADDGLRAGGQLPAQRSRPAPPVAGPGQYPDTTQPIIPGAGTAAGSPIPTQPIAPLSPAPLGPGPVPGSPPAAPVSAAGYPANDETMILPAFVTGRKEPAPKPAEPARHRPEGALPASERGMLVFVAALLGVGTIAVVTMLGMGGLNPRTHSPAPTRSVPVTTPPGSGTAAGPPGALDPSPDPSALTGSPSPVPSRRTTSSPARTLAGTPNPYAYCMVSGALARPPQHDDPSWACVSRRRTTDFTADQVCDWQFGAQTYAVVGNLADPTTWRCYR